MYAQHYKNIENLIKLKCYVNLPSFLFILDVRSEKNNGPI